MYIAIIFFTNIFIVGNQRLACFIHPTMMDLKFVSTACLQYEFFKPAIFAKHAIFLKIVDDIN